MDFSFSPEQEMLRDQVRSYLGDRLPPERVAELAESDAGWDEKSWREIAELGWTGLSLPESAGGAGMTFLDEAVVLEELGRGLYPGPYLATVGLALPAVAADDELAGRVAAGEATVTLAWAEDDRVHLGPGTAPATTAARAGGGWSLTGRKVLVVDLDKASEVVVTAAAEGGVGLWCAAVEDVASEALSTMDTTRRYSNLTLEGAAARPLVGPDDGGEVLERIRLRACAGLALEAVGVAQRVLELAIEFASSRHQFDKPIGAYQAVSHQVADTYVDVELARSLAYWAAWCVSEGDVQAPAAAAAAKAFAGEAAVRACERSIQVHGGIGFTWEHVLHRYYKRAQWIDSFGGFGAPRRAELAALLLD